MIMIVLWLFLLTILVPPGNNQVIPATLTQIPECAITCSMDVLSAGQCPCSEIKHCLCRNTTLQSELFVCVQRNCGLADQLKSASIQYDFICSEFPRESRSKEIIRTTIIITAITFPIMVLRLISRYCYAYLWLDDWLTVVSLILMIPMTVIPIINAQKGFGNHAWDVPLQNITLLRQTYYISQLLYVIVQNIAKISILLLYLRIFPNRGFRLWTILLIVWITLCAVSFLMAVILQCVPINAVWDLTIKAKCISSTGVVFAGAGSSIAEDLVIMILPMRQLRNLQLSLKKRIALVFIFVLGSFACVTSMVRLNFIIAFSSNSVDVTWEQVDVVIWSIIEIYTAMICACIIALRPFLVRFLPALFHSTKITSNTNTNTSPSHKPSSLRLETVSKFWSTKHNGSKPLRRENMQGLAIKKITNFEMRMEGGSERS